MGGGSRIQLFNVFWSFRQTVKDESFVKRFSETPRQRDDPFVEAHRIWKPAGVHPVGAEGRA